MMFLAAVAVSLLALAAGQQCPPKKIPVVKGNGPIKFAVIGDWGRIMSVKSLTNTSAGGYDSTGLCGPNFGPITDETVRGGVGQQSVADSLAQNAKGKADFIINTGDNFYECGVESLSRFETDWKNVYLTKSKPYLNKLKWYNTIGNHDLPLDSLPLQFQYATKDSRWVLPCRYYAVDYVSQGKEGGSVRIIYINTNAFISKYLKPSSKYYITAAAELNATSSPEAIKAQMDWIKATLASSKADWNIIVGHHPMVSGTADVSGPVEFGGALQNEPKVLKGLDQGNSGAWTTLYNLINEYKVDLYFNGHDHIMGYQVDPIDPVKHKTGYVTSGAGGLGAEADGCGSNTGNGMPRSYIKYTGGVNFGPCNDTGGTGYPGYNLVRILPKKAGIQVDYYTLTDYKDAKSTKKSYSFTQKK